MQHRLRRVALVAGSLVIAVGLTAVTGAAQARPDPTALARERVEAASRVTALARTAWKTGTQPVELVYTWSVRWLVAQRDQKLPAKAWKQALADHVTRMTELEREVAAAVNAGTATPIDREQASYFRIEAELWQARGKLP